MPDEAHRIQEAHPLKQGLKPSIKTGMKPGYPIQEAHPLKQGLKHLYPVGNDICDIIQEAHPLKQGLKLSSCYLYIVVYIIQEAHPLKQGLKLSWSPDEIQQCQNSRGTSTKTRIETFFNIEIGHIYTDSRGTSTKTRISKVQVNQSKLSNFGFTFASGCGRQLHTVPHSLPFFHVEAAPHGLVNKKEPLKQKK